MEWLLNSTKFSLDIQSLANESRPTSEVAKTIAAFLVNPWMYHFDDLPSLDFVGIS